MVRVSGRTYRSTATGRGGRLDGRFEAGIGANLSLALEANTVER
jgi:hypothetical protein